MLSYEITIVYVNLAKSVLGIYSNATVLPILISEVVCLVSRRTNMTWKIEIISGNKLDTAFGAN